MMLAMPMILNQTNNKKSSYGKSIIRQRDAEPA
jgi:hypothetical protein